jgi:mannitol/fructose-specific phosphotransferase system IIA component (Ntr-type)
MLAAARLLQNRDIRKALRTARTSAEVAAIIGYSTEPAPAAKT